MKILPGLAERLHELITASLAAQNTTTSTSAFVLRVLEEADRHYYLTKDADVMSASASTPTPVKWSHLTDVVETVEVQRVLRAAAERFDALRGLADLDILRVPTSFDAALDRPGEVIAAWERDDNDQRTLYALAVGAAGWKLLYTTLVEPSDRALVVDRIVTRQRRIGSRDRNCEFAWVADTRGLSIWSPERHVLHVASGDLRLHDRHFRIDELVRIESYRDKEWQGDHGVVLVHRDGTHHVVANYDPGHHTFTDPGGHVGIELFAYWCIWLGRDMSDYLGIPHHSTI